VAAADGDTTIAGTVTDRASAQPLAGICVSARGASTADATTGADGTYVLEVPAPSGTATQVQVAFIDCNTHHYAAQWFDDAATATDATLLAADGARHYSGIDAALDVGGAITGEIRADGVPVQGICTTVTGGVGTSLDAYPGAAPTAGAATSAADGTWAVTGLSTGRYRVAFHDCRAQPEYLDQWYDDSPSGLYTTPVDVTVAQTTTGIDADLHRGGSIEGRVTDPDGNPALDVCVTTKGGVLARVDVAGQYRLAPLPAGTYTVHFASCGRDPQYVPEYWDDMQNNATPVSVIGGQTTPGIDAVLAWAVTLRGTARRADGAPLRGACISAYGTNGHTAARVTEPDGTWSLGPLPAEGWVVQARGCNADATLADRWFRDARSRDAATTILLPRGGVASDIDFSLPPGGAISGRVVDDDGHPVAGGCVDIGGTAARSVRTNNDGTYRVGGLPTGEYTVLFSGCNAGWAFPRFYGGATTSTDQPPVHVVEGAETVGIDAQLRFPGAIAGTVRDRAGRPLSFVCVTSPGAPNRTVFTDTLGRFTFDYLVAGDYALYFSDCGGQHGAYAQWWRGSDDRSGATLVTVTARSTTDGIDPVLDRGGILRGQVAVADDLGPQGICVDAVGPAPRATTTRVQTDADGVWVATLREGRYLVRFSSCGRSVVEEWWRDGVDATDADVVDVVGTETTSIASQVSAGEEAGPFVLVGRHGVSIAAGAIVSSGDVAVHARRRDGQAEVRLGDGVTVADRVVGDTVEAGNGDVVGDLWSNERKGAAVRVLRGTNTAQVPLVRLPTHRAAEPGANDVMIAAGVAEISSGHYRDLVVEPGATLRLTGGRYDARSLRVEPGGQLLFRLPSQLRVAGTVTVGAGAFVGPGPLSGLGARNFRVDVDGATVTIGDGAHVAATVDAPSAALTTGANVDLVGGYLADVIAVGPANHVRWWSGFADDPT
jgi:hypothetical protein